MVHKSNLILAVLFFLPQAVIFGQEESNRTVQASVIVYGGTSSAITAAVQIKRMGKSVVVVSPETRLGGMTSSGLGSTDFGDKEVVGGLAREFYHRVWRHYQSPDVWKWQKKEDFGNRGQGSLAVDGEMRTMWIFEPEVASNIFESWILENEFRFFGVRGLTGIREWNERTEKLFRSPLCRVPGIWGMFFWTAPMRAT